MQYEFRFDLVLGHMPELFRGVLLTVELSVIAMLIGIFFAIFGALARMHGPRPLQIVVTVYVEIIRNTPFLVQLFVIFFGLPTIGLRLSPDACAVTAMIINVAAYVTEILRAGIESVAKGQIEAGKALGLKYPDIFRYIILRPAVKAVYPSLTSQYILLMLQSSVVSAISAEELTALASDIASNTFSYIEVYLVVAAIYFVLGLAFSAVFKLIFFKLFAYKEA